MSEPRRLSSSLEPSLESIEEESLLALQIQAFLEASDEVDIDKETVEDLMQVLSQTQESENIDAEGCVNGGASSDQQNNGQSTEPGSQGNNLNFHVSTFAYARPEPVWSMQEVKVMLHHLKERG